MSQKPIVQRKGSSATTESEPMMKVDTAELPTLLRIVFFITVVSMEGVWSRSRSNRVLWRCWRLLICWILRPNEPITPIQKSPWLGCVLMPRRSWSSTKPS